MDLYANYLVLMSININENMRSKRKIGEEVGVYLKISHISVGNCLREPKLVPNKVRYQPFYLLIRYANCLIIIFMNINENIRNERKSWKILMRVYLQNYSYLNRHIS